MADDKNAREKQARDEERRQRERAVAEDRRRHDEPKPPIDEADLSAVEAALDEVGFPATAADVVDVLGDQTLESVDRTYEVADLLPESDLETFDDPVEVRKRVEKPTVATAMKRIVEAATPLRDAELGRSQRDAYERTLEELVAIDAVDEDEGITVITEWIVEQIEETDDLPGSRDVRRRAAKYCRAQGYTVRSDEWLGV